MATATPDLDDIDLSAGMVPHPPTHPAGRVTAFDEETGLPIVKRHTRVERTPHSVSVERETVEKGPAKHAETGRDILHGSKDRATLVNLAKKHASALESGLKEAAQSVPGAHFDAVRSEKTPERMTEKIEKENQPVETIPDILAGRIKVDTPEAHHGAVNAIKQRFNVIRDQDEFDKGDEQTGYRVHKLQVKMSPELSAEVHVVPKEIAAVNDKQHDAYDKMREAALDAKNINDGAMEKFEERNDENGGKVEAEKSDETDSRIARDGQDGTGQSGNGAREGRASGLDHSAAEPQATGNDKRPAPDETVRRESNKLDSRPVSEGLKALKLGDHVTLPDGRSATVAYVPGKNSQIPTYRFTTPDGKTVNLRAKQVESGVKPADSNAPDNAKGDVLVDLDKTLAFTHGPQFSTHIGAPEPAMVKRIKQDIADGKKVKIFTARVANDPDGKVRDAIQRWAKKHIGADLEVTDKKDQSAGTILDDKAKHVDANTGKVRA